MSALEEARRRARRALAADPDTGLAADDASDAPGARLVVHGWRVEGTTVVLDHELVGIARFAEELELHDVDGRALAIDATDPVVAGALDLLALTTAVSYAKATLPEVIEVPPLPAAARTMLAGLLTDGLAELAHANGLGPLDGTVEVVGPERAPAVPSSLRGGELITIGGGKDSAVTAVTAARAHRRDGAPAGPAPLAFAVNARAPMRASAELAGLGLVTAVRRLDRTLLGLNARGAIDGHVPITAIVTTCALVAAAATGRGTVLVSNEASAAEPTRMIDGWRVNHQWSKSPEFARLLSAAVDATSGGALRVVSPLAVVPELLVARAAASLPGLTAATTSCNAGFALDATTTGWCGACPKCRFVQTMLAPFVARDRLVADLGFDALDDPDQLAGIAALLDPATKPFECVGTVEEVRLALDLAADRADWADAHAVAALGRAGTGAGARLAALATAVDATVLPAPYDAWAQRIAAGTP